MWIPLLLPQLPVNAYGKRSGDSKHPGLTPVSTGNASVRLGSQICVHELDNGDHLVRNTIVASYSPQGWLMYTIKSFGKVNEVDIDGCIPFVALFNYLPKWKYLVGTGWTFSEASLFFMWHSIGQFCHPVILLRTFDVVESNMIPLQLLLQLVRSPF